MSPDQKYWNQLEIEKEEAIIQKASRFLTGEYSGTILELEDEDSQEPEFESYPAHLTENLKLTVEHMFTGINMAQFYLAAKDSIRKLVPINSEFSSELSHEVEFNRRQNTYSSSPLTPEIKIIPRLV